MNGALKTWIPKLAGQRILVVGDVILDEYVLGRATRLSREAPVPILEYESRQMIPGGATNPAVNIARLGSTAVQAGVIGSDTAATQLRQLLQAKGIETNALVVDPTRPTTVKLRLMAQMGLRFPQQVARLDTLSREPINGSIEAQLGTLIEKAATAVNAILVSDYHGGLLTESLIAEIRRLGGIQGALLAADAQGELDKYQHFALVKCNADDARAYLRRHIEGDDEFAEAARELCQRLQLTGAMVITRGPEGATIAMCAGGMAHCPSPAVSDVYDVVGAGDTAIAVLTLAVAAGAPFAEAVTLANYASGLVVRRVGNYAPSADELAWALDTWSNRA
ncbi:MAG: ribokinase [Anaerolineaceae bacterium]|nr:ribokinase [Anaerolineaceae bacterium]